MVELLYAMNADGRMVHIDDVPNGIACRCHCPCCHAPLVAKNNGETIAPHFAHASGAACSGAHESELHLLAKEVISDERAVMLPRYGNVYDGGMIRFDAIEVEQRNDISSLQPDLCGVVYNKNTGKDSRLWIEIMVTHAIGPDKRALITRHNIACIEINMSQFINRQVTRHELTAFLTSDRGSREWINNPTLEKRRLSSAAHARTDIESKIEENRKMMLKNMSAYELEKYYTGLQDEYLAQHKDCCIQDSKNCYRCKHHTTRNAIFEEVRRLHLPAWLKETLSGNLLFWTRDSVKDTVVFRDHYVVQFDNYLKLLPTTTPDIHGRQVSPHEIRQNNAIIPFLLNTVPSIIASEGLRCKHNIHSFSTASHKYKIACNMPNVVNRHRRKR